MVATSDNPRSEEPLAILAEIEPGLKDSGVQATPSSRIAPRPFVWRFRRPRLETWFFIAGKGHEKEQILASGVDSF